jgi:hypothetical protein
MGRISMPQGKGSQLHNRRDYEKIGREVPDNIDKNLTRENITLVDKDIREAYQEIFGEALAQYNDKQKRADRRIENYYEHIAKSKNGEKLFYEDVLQWGKKEDFENPQTRKMAKEALVRYASTFEQRNPNLRLIGAYIHMDEASPHLHLDYVPVAHGYSRGLSTRNSLDKAMKEMGFVPEKESRKNNATKLWKENERAYFGELCRSMGLEVEAERKARGSLSVEEYKEVREEMLGEIEQEYAEKKAQVESMDEITSYIASGDRNGIKAEDYTIEAKKSFLGQIKEPERVGVFVENMGKEQVESLMQRIKADERIESILARTQEQCKSLIAKAQTEAKEIRAEATADRNEAIAKAEQIKRNEQNITTRAREWAESVKKQYQEVADKVKELLGLKTKLETEIKDLQAQSKALEPVKAEVRELQRAKDILTGAVENEITQSKFKDWSDMPYGTRFSGYIERGELLALYKDGSIRQVGFNPNRGWDHKTLDDQKSGLCRVGLMVAEERVTIPRNLLKELIGARDKTKPISQNLENMISQQNAANRVISKVKEKGRGGR